MNTYSLNHVVGGIGLIILLVGLLPESHPLGLPSLGPPLTGVGGSILATALVNWILTRQLGSIPISSIVEALAQKTEFMRTNHEAELTFTLQDGRVKLEKRHLYHLRNTRHYTRPRRVSSICTICPTNARICRKRYSNVGDTWTNSK